MSNMSNTMADSGGAPHKTVASGKDRRIGRLLIAIAVVVLFLLLVGGALIGWFIYSTKRANSWTTITSFHADFQENSPRPGWRYLWNPAGEIGKTNHYVDLVWNGSAYGPNDNPERPQPGPAHFLRVSKSGGHPGHGKPQRGDIDTYVIFALTVTNRGFFVITNSSFVRNDAKINGDVNLRVYLNETLVGPEVTCDTKTSVSFDRPLGDLNPNDWIYVAVGPNGMDRNDSFGLDFAVAFRKGKNRP
jgi:hypothetical protein